MLVKQWRYVVSSSKSGNAEISDIMAHWVVPLHETKKGNSLPHDVDYWKMSSENHWLEC